MNDNQMWALKCKNCSGTKGDHQAVTLACPFGKKTRVGYLGWSPTTTFEARPYLTAVQKPNGDFEVRNMKDLPFANIVRQGHGGWRVINHVPGRKSSRTISPTAMLAAKKYFDAPVIFPPEALL